MALRYKDKVTIVTGGSKGIGKGCVEVFEKDGKAVEAEVNAKGPGEATFIPCDVTKEDQIMNVIDQTVKKYGRIDCLINNAGRHPPFHPIDDFSAEDFRQLLNMNLVNYFLFAKYSLPHLRKTQGNIINDSSLVGQIGQLEAVTYVSTKGAITAMTKALAIDEAKYNVRVNSIAPGNIWTPMWAEGAESTENAEATVKAGENCQLLGRMGTIEESGLACLYLAADATFCTGIELNLSGGAELSYGNKSRMSGKGVYD
ncbi:17-beta-hydroxysteroid dehydrogenase 14 isoform X2 [Lingula anatina]|uniref:17-beta-hydroxysteroid dehydrogenase 14 isoform X2 n=1 Tax=Lingula anatina TaxID=7574 RepID=A0A1S3JVU8_LINAN|nr:17-beta-hydroxysteroid dehydrogenase 14 isoform X2 [Lingula anatina]|eukprot:XP_013414513.1 17-beta-hydroxysteroid dehydrogenase 14 isoform X2 [Lingula anatina]